MPSKMLLVFCDGTSHDGILAEPPSPANNNVEVVFSDTFGGPTNAKNPSNVLRLSRAVKRYSTTGEKEQLVFYQTGVGSETDFNGDAITPGLRIFGTAVASKIRDAYAFIAQNFDEGDEICLFGYSRGAYTARKLAGLIDRIGLLTAEGLGYFFTIWRQLIDGKQPTIPPGTRTTRIKCVGVWDTVAALLIPNWQDALNIKDTDIPASVDVALHAVAFQENRDWYLPTMWAVPKDGLAPGQVFKQLWFPGAHADVGGGYIVHELSDLALFWMTGEVESFISLDLELLQRSQPPSDAWGASQPRNAFSELQDFQKPFIKAKTRLDSGDITQDSVFHESIKYAPSPLTSPEHMVTLEILKQKFGSGWEPVYPPLNAFEQRCKDSWGKRALNGVPTTYEEISDLLGSPGN